MRVSSSRYLAVWKIVAAVLLPGILLSTDARAMSRHPKTFPIHLAVDFGPAGKALHEETLYVEKGTTPREAVAQVFPVLLGKACCSLREVLAIDGVKIDPAKNHWWVCRVNGSKKISPLKKKLKAGDRLEWQFIQESQ